MIRLRDRSLRTASHDNNAARRTACFALRTCALGLAWIVAIATSATARTQDDRRPMTVEDLWAMDRVGAPVVSPDGARVVFPVTRYSMETNDSERRLWIVPVDGSEPEQPVTRGPRDGSPAFSPDGRHLAFVSSRDDGPAQLWVLPLDGGEARRVTDLPTAVVDPRWLPDGSGILFLAATWPDLDDDWKAVRKRIEKRSEDKVGAHVTENRTVRHWDRYTTDGRVPHVFWVPIAKDSTAAPPTVANVVDLTPGSARLMNFDSWDGQWDIAPDGRTIVLSANDTAPPYRTLDFDLFTIPITIENGTPRGGTWTSITDDNPGDDFRPRYAADGSGVVYGRRVRAEIEPEFTRLARYSFETRTPRDLYAGSTYSPSEWTVAPDGAVFFHAQDRGRTNLFVIEAEADDVALVERGGVTSNVALTPSGLVYQRQSIQSPPELWFRPYDSVEARVLTHRNDDRISALDLGTVEDVTFRGHGDDRVQMWIVYPPGFTPRDDWPLLQIIHGGPHGASLDRWHPRWNLALFASTGAVVTAVNFHGSTGFGQAFAESILGNHAEKPYADIELATDYMLGRGYIDRDRLVAAGGSYGGYLVAWILGHTDRYAALINHAGVYDLLAQFGSDFTWGRANNYGAAPWDDPARISECSPSHHPHLFETPTLILHGERDYRVPAHHGILLHGVLTAKGVRSRLVLFPDEHHFILKPQAARLWWNEIFAWLREYAGTR